MFGIVRSLRICRNLTGALRNSWSEMPFTISLAVGGISLQAYSSYMLVTTGKLANFANFGVEQVN